MDPISTAIAILAVVILFAAPALAVGASVFGDLGPATAIWDVDGVALDLQPIHGGIEFNDEVKTKEIFEDAKGEMPVDEVFTGRICSLVVNMSRSTLAQLAAMIPSASVAGDVMTVKCSVGTQMRALAKKVTIKKVVDGVVSTNPDDWITVPLAYPKTTVQWKFNNTDQRVTSVKFAVFPLDTSGHVGDVWYIGQ